MSEGNREENSNGRSLKDDEVEKFLKVTPNLFTPGRLHLFDSLDLYTSLIKCSKSIEQGERLHNLSWRIMNKALLRDKDINRSKKRDGLKNLYYVLNPIANKQPLGQQPSGNVVSNASSSSSTPGLRSPSAPKKRAVPRMEPLAKTQTTGASSKLNHGKESLFGNARQHKSTSALSHIQRTKSNKKEEPQVIVRGFDPNTVITSPPKVSEAKKPGDKIKNTFYIEATPSPELDRNSSSTVALRKPLPSRQESLFGKPKTAENAPTSSRRNSLFFSSEEDDDDDSGWDEDSPFYDEDDDVFDHDDDEEDQYYRKQWDKLLFAKNASTKSSGNNTPNSASSHDQIKRSLLSGLFLNEQANSSNKASATSSVTTANGTSAASYRVVATGNHAAQIHNDKRAVYGTSNVNAVGSVTPPDKRLPEALHRNARGSSRGSFSSIVSEQTRERYTGESNAPPAAQTILPTALSTHMFLPNNIHQQRLAMAAAASTDSRRSPAYEPRRKTTRRESIDIPSKNKNNSFIKTRMEISKEEDFVRAYSRRNL